MKSSSLPHPQRKLEEMEGQGSCSDVLFTNFTTIIFTNSSMTQLPSAPFLPLDLHNPFGVEEKPRKECRGNRGRKSTVLMMTTNKRLNSQLCLLSFLQSIFSCACARERVF